MRLEVDPQGFADWTGLLSLLQASFAYMDGRIDPPSSLAAFDAGMLKQKANDETLVLARKEGKPVACAFLRLEKNKVYIGKIAVAPEFQGHGMCRKIIAIAKAHAQLHERGILELETRIELFENHKVFKSLGFEKTFERAHTGFDHPTSITMHCKVEDG